MVDRAHTSRPSTADGVVEIAQPSDVDGRGLESADTDLVWMVPPVALRVGDGGRYSTGDRWGAVSGEDAVWVVALSALPGRRVFVIDVFPCRLLPASCGGIFLLLRGVSGFVVLLPGIWHLVDAAVVVPVVEVGFRPGEW